MFKGKKGILMAVPGAFTPGCSKARRALTRRNTRRHCLPRRAPCADVSAARAAQTHLPSYIADYELLKKKGVDVVVCTATNDPCAPR